MVAEDGALAHVWVRATQPTGQTIARLTRDVRDISPFIGMPRIGKGQFRFDFHKCPMVGKEEVWQVAEPVQVKAFLLVLVANPQRVEEDGPSGFEAAPEPVTFVRRL